MYTVYGSPMTRALRVLWMLEEIGEAYELIPCGPQSKEIRAVNPLGKLPALRYDGMTFTDSSAILQHLADRHGKLAFPAGSAERGRQDGHTFFLLDDIESYLWADFKNRMILPEADRVPEVVPQCKTLAFRGFDALEARLGDGPYLMGEVFTYTDIIAGHLFNWAQYGCQWELPAEGRLAEYIAAVRARPALKAAIANGKKAVEAAKQGAA